MTDAELRYRIMHTRVGDMTLVQQFASQNMAALIQPTDTTVEGLQAKAEIAVQGAFALVEVLMKRVGSNP